MGETGGARRLEAFKGRRRSWTHFVTLLRLHSVTAPSTDRRSLLSLEHFNKHSAASEKLWCHKGASHSGLIQIMDRNRKLKDPIFWKTKNQNSVVQDSLVVVQVWTSAFAVQPECWLHPLTPHYCSGFFQIRKLHHGGVFANLEHVSLASSKQRANSAALGSLFPCTNCVNLLQHSARGEILSEKRYLWGGCVQIKF